MTKYIKLDEFDSKVILEFLFTTNLSEIITTVQNDIKSGLITLDEKQKEARQIAYHVARRLYLTHFMNPDFRHYFRNDIINNFLLYFDDKYKKRADFLRENTQGDLGWYFINGPKQSTEFELTKETLYEFFWETKPLLNEHLSLGKINILQQHLSKALHHCGEYGAQSLRNFFKDETFKFHFSENEYSAIMQKLEEYIKEQSRNGIAKEYFINFITDILTDLDSDPYHLLIGTSKGNSGIERLAKAEDLYASVPGNWFRTLLYTLKEPGSVQNLDITKVVTTHLLEISPHHFGSAKAYSTKVLDHLTKNYANKLTVKDLQYFLRVSGDASESIFQQLKDLLSNFSDHLYYCNPNTLVYNKNGDNNYSDTIENPKFQHQVFGVFAKSQANR